ncbi:MAG: flagellar basal body L-ring protein FlgH [SAR324 cluster bacterium]|nr:flagellar basal body L-ring protein FlgH [SAR324 cluster bacterium]
MKSLVSLLMVLVLLGGCQPLARKSGPQMPMTTQQNQANTVAEQATPKPSAKNTRRPQVSSRSNLYEGSLWRDEASFGNLWRDHRARFNNDLLTIVEVNKIVTVPPAKEKPAETPGAPGDVVQKANLVLEALSLRDMIEEEQNDILRSLDSISAEVIKVLPNGNMLIRGKKTDLRQRNQIRYVTTVTGILRPADVTQANVVSASKLAYPEVKISRQIQGSLVRERLDKLKPLLGQQKAGLMGRITDFTKADNRQAK